VSVAARCYHSSSSSVTAGFVSKLWRLINGGGGRERGGGGNLPATCVTFIFIFEM
jgi:hypothetical protein